MLELRPSCEHCNKALPPESTEARVCSFECTFCADCVDGFLCNVCPNCGGGFERRPVRPARNWKNNNNLEHNPAAVDIKYRPVDPSAHAAFCSSIAAIDPAAR